MTCSVHGSYAFKNVFHNYRSKMLETWCYSDRKSPKWLRKFVANPIQPPKPSNNCHDFKKKFQFWSDRNISIYALNYRIAAAGKVPSIRTFKIEITYRDQIDLARNSNSLHGKIRSNRAEMALYGPTETGERYLIPTEIQPVSLQVSSWPRVISVHDWHEYENYLLEIHLTDCTNQILVC